MLPLGGCVAMIAVEAISVPSGPWGRRRRGGGGVVPRSCAESEWVYVSSEPTVYTLEDFWEEAMALRSRLEELVEPWDK